MIIFLVSLFVFSVEFFLKSYLLTHCLDTSFPLIKNILFIHVVLNKGGAFGIFSGKTNLLIYISIFFIFLVIFFVLKEKTNRILLKVAYGLILGGALSNLFDRITYGYVIDYIDVRFWPVFNLADSAISVGVTILILDSLKKKKTKICNHEEDVKS